MERIDRPANARLKTANLHNKISLLLAGRMGLAYHRFIGSSVHRFKNQRCAVAQMAALPGYIIRTI
ncbi:hypothetical protein [Cognatiyoonia sp. IB215182]|uniref:hypothetical protein n=1 Tax=Cognatiyoonia sp. IB215182 TaxID=3097353 RepID=UPI002A24A143|nr:hypothetical protein [Cognatiyoonia sp. IB215182]